MTIPSWLIGERATLETFSRQQYQAVGLGDGTILCRVLGKYLLYAAAEDIGITPRLCLDGFWESWITLAIARAVERGWHCVDIGANHGYYTLIMADGAESAGRVLAVEPNPQLAELLKRTVQVNGFHRQVHVLQKAVSDADSQTVNLVIPQNRGLNATVCREPTAGDAVVEVETATLDQLTEDWSRVDLVKIDAEGAEDLIWRGMRRTLERNPEIAVIMEMNCARSPDPRSFLQEIQALGFALRHIDYEGMAKDVTEEEILTTRAGEDWMLFLQRA